MFAPICWYYARRIILPLTDTGARGESLMRISGAIASTMRQRNMQGSADISSFVIGTNRGQQHLCQACANCLGLRRHFILSKKGAGLLACRPEPFTWGWRMEPYHGISVVVRVMVFAI